MRELLRIVGLNIADDLEDNLEDDALKGLLSHEAILGSNLGPRSPGSILSLLYKQAINNGLFNSTKYDFHKLIGIELETSSHKEAIQKLNHYNHIILLNQNMETYQFPNENIILYMYESLFSIRDIIYNHVMKNLQKVNKKVYIIYISENQKGF